MYYNSNENKVETLKSLLKDDFKKLVSAYYGKPLSVVANSLGVPCDILAECCKRNGVKNWSKLRTKKTHKTLKNKLKSKNNSYDDDFIVGTYEYDDDDDYVNEKEEGKKENVFKSISKISNKTSQKLTNKECEMEIEFSSDDESIKSEILTVDYNIQTKNTSDTESDNDQFIVRKLLSKQKEIVRNDETKYEKKVNLYSNSNVGSEFVTDTSSIKKPTTTVVIKKQCARKSVCNPALNQEKVIKNNEPKHKQKTSSNIDSNISTIIIKKQCARKSVCNLALNQEKVIKNNEPKTEQKMSSNIDPDIRTKILTTLTNNVTVTTVVKNICARKSVYKPKSK